MFARHDIAAKLVGTAIAVAAVGLTAPGSADGVGFANPPELIDKAEVVCAAFSGGLSPARMHPTLDDSAMTPRQAALFMADAVQAYCPNYADLLFS